MTRNLIIRRSIFRRFAENLGMWIASASRAIAKHGDSLSYWVYWLGADSDRRYTEALARDLIEHYAKAVSRRASPETEEGPVIISGFLQSGPKAKQ